MLHLPVRLSIEVIVSRILILVLPSSCRSRRTTNIKREVVPNVSVEAPMLVRIFVLPVRVIKVQGTPLSRRETVLKLFPVVSALLPFLDGKGTLAVRFSVLKVDEVGGLHNFVMQIGLVQILDTDVLTGDFYKMDMVDLVRVSGVVPKITIVVFGKRGSRSELIRMVTTGTIREEVYFAV